MSSEICTTQNSLKVFRLNLTTINYAILIVDSKLQNLLRVMRISRTISSVINTFINYKFLSFSSDKKYLILRII